MGHCEKRPKGQDSSLRSATEGAGLVIARSDARSDEAISMNHHFKEKLSPTMLASI